MADLDREPILEGGARVVYRHRLPTRIWHWLNAAVILVMRKRSFDPTGGGAERSGSSAAAFVFFA
jgi:hypothetical protein